MARRKKLATSFATALRSSFAKGAPKLLSFLVSIAELQGNRNQICDVTPPRNPTKNHALNGPTYQQIGNRLSLLDIQHGIPSSGQAPRIGLLRSTSWEGEVHSVASSGPKMQHIVISNDFWST